MLTPFADAAGEGVEHPPDAWLEDVTREGGGPREIAVHPRRASEAALDVNEACKRGHAAALQRRRPA